MTANDIRRSFLQYFERHRHRIVASAPLVPHEDPTLLFTNAGMNQFKDVFLGRERRDYSRATTSQKCMRVSGKHNDLNNVGPSLRHHTFFEMLGNFSFGDYFKQDAIPFAWTLLTTEWKLPEDRLYATIFRGEPGIPRDDAAFDIWRTFLPVDRIGELGAADNFWQMGDTGPCGRCSEIYYYRGAGVPCAEEAAGRVCRGLECDCDRFIEIWNNVFMEFDRQPDGTLNPLPAPSIDTGMGLERVTAVLQGHLSNYDTDLFTPLLAAIGGRAGLTYRGSMEPADVSMRVVADHMRAMTFLIADGVVPSNEWRGYVLRKIMRRAMRHGKRLGMAEPFLHTLVDTLVAGFGEAYPEIATGRDAIARVIHSEEDRFDAVLTSGLPRLEEALDRAAADNNVLDGDVAFKLYDTYGLPRDFIEDMAEDRKVTLDPEGFERAMEGQRVKARAKSGFKKQGDTRIFTYPGSVGQELQQLEDRFRGYDAVEVTATVLALFRDAGEVSPASSVSQSLEEVDRKTVERFEYVAEIMEGQDAFVLLSETPFYLESGGQVSDVGRLVAPKGEAAVRGVSRQHGFGPRLHAVTIVRGSLAVGDIVVAEVTGSVRDATRRNHTATHLLHAALRKVLGDHVKQKGSLVAPDRLRFDFAHFSAIAREQLLEIESIVNEQVLANTPVHTDVKPTQEAIAGGATALFGEKYGDTVRVVSIPGFSTELCGGTHVRATGDIGLFTITAESGVSAGVRRVEALTGMTAVGRAQLDRDISDALLQVMLESQLPPSIAALIEISGGVDVYREIKRKAARAIESVAKLHSQSKKLEQENQQLRRKQALSEQSPDVDVAGVKLVAQEVSGLDKDGLRALVDQHRSRIKSGVVVLASGSDGKVAIVVGVTPDLTKRAPAGQIVKQLAPIVGGGGGGRPDFAEAGGKDASKIAEMLAASRGVVEKMLT